MCECVNVFCSGSLDTPLPLNRDGKGLGTQAVKTCTRSIRKVLISCDVAATAHDNCVTSEHAYYNYFA